MRPRRPAPPGPRMSPMSVASITRPFWPVPFGRGLRLPRRAIAARQPAAAAAVQDAPRTRLGVLELYREMWKYAEGARGYMLLSMALLFGSQLIKLLLPWMAAQAIDAIQKGASGGVAAAALWVAAIVGVFVLGWAMHGPGRVIERMVGLRVRHVIADRLYTRLSDTPLAWRERRHAGELQHRMGQTTGALYDFTQNQFVYVQNAVSLVGPLVALALLSTLSGLIAALGFVVRRLGRRRLRPPADEARRRGERRRATLRLGAARLARQRRHRGQPAPAGQHAAPARPAAQRVGRAAAPQHRHQRVEVVHGRHGERAARLAARRRLRLGEEQRGRGADRRPVHGLPVRPAGHRRRRLARRQPAELRARAHRHDQRRPDLAGAATRRRRQRRRHRRAPRARPRHGRRLAAHRRARRAVRARRRGRGRRRAARRPARRVDLAAPRRAHRPRRPQRLGQEHAAARARRPLRAAARPRRGRRRRLPGPAPPRRERDAAAAGGAGVRGDGAREHRLRPGARRRGGRRGDPHRLVRRPSSPACPRGSTRRSRRAAPTSPAASASACAWRAARSPRRAARCCCSTSRRARSTR